MENINLWLRKSERGTPTNKCSGESKHRAILMPALKQMLLPKQHVLLAILRSPGAYLCLNWATRESKRALTKAVELIYSPWHLADAEPPSSVPTLRTSILPSCCLWMTHLSSLTNPTACLTSPMKTGRVTYIKDAAFSIKGLPLSSLLQTRNLNLLS